jgi:hypothetical protein
LFGRLRHFINQSIPFTTNLGTAQALLWALKESLIGFDTLPWTVVLSSNSVSAGAADYWTTSANLIWTYATAAAYSWIVLQQNGIATGFQVLIECNRTNTNANNHQYLRVSVSPSVGFTWVSTTGPPTAADSPSLTDATSVGTIGLWGPGNSIGHRLHVMQSTDGQCTRVFINQTNDGDTVGFWIFDKAKNPVSGWTNPWLAGVLGSNSASVPTVANLNDLSTRIMANGVSAMGLFLTGEGAVTSMVTEQVTVANSFDSSWPMAKMGILSTTASNVGRHGEVFDLWYGSNGRANADQYPSSGTLYQFTQFGQIIHPWNSLAAVQVT